MIRCMNRNARSNDESLRAQAIAMREQGDGNPAIRAALGLTAWDLTRLFQGHVEPKHENLANRAKPEHRTRARELRGQGWSYDAIARELWVSKSSLSLWLRDLPKPARTYPGTPPEDREMNQEDWEAHCQNHTAAYWRRKSMETRRELTEAADEVGELSDRELLIVGAMVYWCEGAKSKPWRRQTTAILINSDPDLIRLYLRFLALCGWGVDRLTFRISIHENADVEAATRYWAEVAGVVESRFKKPTLKKHNPITVRKNIGDHYQGCLIVTALKSAALYRQIEGHAQAVMCGSDGARLGYLLSEKLNQTR